MRFSHKTMHRPCKHNNSNIIDIFVIHFPNSENYIIRRWVLNGDIWSILSCFLINILKKFFWELHYTYCKGFAQQQWCKWWSSSRFWRYITCTYSNYIQRLQFSAQVLHFLQESTIGQTDDGNWNEWLYPQCNWTMIHVWLLQQRRIKSAENVLKYHWRQGWGNGNLWW